MDRSLQDELVEAAAGDEPALVPSPTGSVSGLSVDPVVFMPPLYLRPSGWQEHVPFAFWVTGALRPRTVVELGTHHGVSYFAFCQAVERRGLATRCYAVDAWKGDEHAGFYGPEVFRAVRDHNAELYSRFSVLMQMTFDEALPHFADGEIDLLHIDGYHTYEAAKRDFEAWLPKLSERAVVLLHDTNERKDDFGVYRLVEELRNDYPVFEFSHGHGLTVVGVGGDQTTAMLELYAAASDDNQARTIQDVFSRLGRACQSQFTVKTLSTQVGALTRERDRARDELAAKLAEHERKAVEHERTSADHERRIEAMTGELRTSAAELEAKASQLRAKATAADEAHRKLMGTRRSLAEARKALHAKQREIKRLRNSRSWKITAPMRAIMRVLRGTKPAPAKAPRPSKGAENTPVAVGKPDFDARWYTRFYPDVSSSGTDPATHYRLVGRDEGRYPTAEAFRKAEAPAFDPAWYLSMNPDVARNGMDPLTHYAFYGRNEGRLPAPAKSMDSSVGPIRRSYRDWDEGEEEDFVALASQTYQANGRQIDRCLVTVVMPAYNRASMIGAAIQSVLEQSHRNFELLVIDDGSTDDTVKVAESFADPRIRILRLARQGVSGARNAGLMEARGDLVAYLDTDNTWTPDHLRRLATYLLASGVTAAYSGMKALDDDGVLRFYRGARFDYAACLKSNYIDLNTLGHRRLDFSRFKFDRNLRRLVDWDYILGLAQLGGVSFLPYIGVTYYDGKEHDRISWTEYQEGDLHDITDRIRKRHRVAADTSEELSVRWRDGFGNPGGRFIGDTLSAPFEQADADGVDWVSLESRSPEPGLVSVVVLAYEGYELTRSCVQSILEHGSTRAMELLVVDNGGSDDTHSRIAKEFGDDPRVATLRLETNLMYAAGNNAGFARTTGEFVVFLNNDTIVTPGWLDALIAPLEIDATVGAVGPKLLYDDDTIQCCGLAFSSASKIPYHIYRGHRADAPEVNHPRVFQALTGACLALRAEDFAHVRGFDPAFINGCEDIDLALRLRQRLQTRALYVPDSVVYHLESRTPGRGTHIMRNREMFVRRWGDEVTADDQVSYAEDGFEVAEYVKAGSESDGPTAIYTPRLSKSAPAVPEQKVFNVGFSSIWHTRGVTFVTKQLADAIEGADVRTHIFARWESDRFENAGPVHHPRVFNAGDDPSAEAMLEWVRENDIDCVVFVEVHPKDWKRAEALKAAGVTIVCYEHLDILRVDSLARYDLFDIFLFSSFTARECFLRRFPAKRSILIPWATPLPPAPADLGEMADRSLRFVHVAGWGGLNDRKNTDLVIKAFDQAGVAGAELHIYTQQPISKYGEEVAAICAANHTITVIEGTVEDIAEAYHGKDVLVWPSKREGVGLPIIEALASGLAVIISDGYLMRQWVLPEVHGLICSARPRFGPMMLPEMVVDEESLIRQIREVASDRDEVRRLRDAVIRDRSVWTWGWQADVLREQFVGLVSQPHYRPSESLDYLPGDILRFEAARRGHGHWSGPESQEPSGDGADSADRQPARPAQGHSS